MCLLHMIAERPAYGYALLQSVAGAFPDAQERTVYAILRRLRETGLTDTFTDANATGPIRKYYRITPAGEARLRELCAGWDQLVRGVARVRGADDSAGPA